MKKIVTLLAFALSALIAFAQHSGIRLTPKIGASFNSIYGHPSGETPWGYKFSPWLFGVEASREGAGRWAPSAGLYFLRRGTHGKLSYGRRLDDYYFEYLVLTAETRYALFPRLRLELFTGPYVGYCTGAGVKYYGEEDFTDYRHDDFDDFDFGAHVGLNKHFDLAGFDVLVQPRFQLGLTRFSFTKHISFQLMLGVRL